MFRTYWWRQTHSDRTDILKGIFALKSVFIPFFGYGDGFRSEYLTSRDFVKFRCTRVHGYLVTLHTCLFTVLVLPQLGEGCGKCFARTQSRSQHFWNLILNWKFPTWVSNSLLTRGFPRSIRSLRIVGDVWYTIHWTCLGRSQGEADNARAVDRTLTS